MTLSTRSAIIIAALAIALPATARADGPLDRYLPKSGTIEGHVMRLGVAPEDQALNRKFRAAVQSNMDWFKNYVTANKPGQLPYDPRMGVTKAEYDELQHMTADFQPVAPITIEVRKDNDGGIGFTSASPAAAALNKVTFAVGEKVAATPYGALSTVSDIHQSDAKAPIGDWNGIEWAQVKEEGAAEPSAKIAFGKREPSGEGVFYYQIAAYKDHDEQSLVVFYKLD